jgi:hypothetical protein
VFAVVISVSAIGFVSPVGATNSDIASIMNEFVFNPLLRLPWNASVSTSHYDVTGSPSVFIVTQDIDFNVTDTGSGLVFNTAQQPVYTFGPVTSGYTIVSSSIGYTNNNTRMTGSLTIRKGSSSSGRTLTKSFYYYLSGYNLIKVDIS